MNAYLCLKPLLQLFFNVRYINGLYFFSLLFCLGRLVFHSCNKLFRLTCIHSLVENFICIFQLAFFILKRAEKSCLTRRKYSLGNQLFYIIVQRKKSYCICNGRSAFAHAFCHLFLSEIKLVHKALHTFRFFYCIEVLSLKIVYKCNNSRLLLIVILDNSRNIRNTGYFRRSPTTFAGDKHISGAYLSDNNRIDYAVSRNRFGKCVESLFIKRLSRLRFIRIDVTPFKYHVICIFAYTLVCLTYGQRLVK